jgi:hypothetical protein
MGRPTREQAIANALMALIKLADEIDERLCNAENEIRQVRDILAKLSPGPE